MTDKNLLRYAEFFERLTVENLSELSTVMTEDIHFVDPFNDVRGLAVHPLAAAFGAALRPDAIA